MNKTCIKCGLTLYGNEQESDSCLTCLAQLKPHCNFDQGYSLIEGCVRQTIKQPIEKPNMTKPIEEPNYKINILWGEAPEDTDKPITYSFDSEAELNAFKLGISEMDGWQGYEIVEQTGIQFTYSNLFSNLREI